MKGNKVITDIEQFTPELLTRIFKNKGYLNNGIVTKIIRRNSLEKSTTNVHFLELIFSNDTPRKDISSNIVVKISKPNAIKLNAKIMNMHEAKFYNHVAEEINGIPTPTCYDVAFSEENGLSHIILEDLSTTHIEYDDSSWPIPPSKLLIEKVVDCLAEFHLLWWDHKKLQDLSKNSFVFYTFKENSLNEKEIISWFENESRALNRMLKFLGYRISDNRKELLETVFSIYPQEAYERIKQENITLIHSDAHLGNFFYPKDITNQKSKAILLDWHTWGIGVGCQDLSYLIGLWFYPDYRHLIEKDLIKRYHSNLIKFGIKDYSWDDCWDDYRFSAFLNLYRIIYWWGHEYTPRFWWGPLERVIFTLEDLNCMELLEG